MGDARRAAADGDRAQGSREAQVVLARRDTREKSLCRWRAGREGRAGLAHDPGVAVARAVAFREEHNQAQRTRTTSSRRSMDGRPAGSWFRRGAGRRRARPRSRTTRRPRSATSFASARRQASGASSVARRPALTLVREGVLVDVPLKYQAGLASCLAGSPHGETLGHVRWRSGGTREER